MPPISQASGLVRLRAGPPSSARGPDEPPSPPGGVRSSMAPTTTGTGDELASTMACEPSGPTGEADGATGRGVFATIGAAVGLTGFLVGLAVGRAVGRGVGLATVFAVGLGVGLGVARGVGRGVGFGVGLGVGFGVGFGVGLGVGTGVGLGVGVGVAAGPTVNDPPDTSHVAGGVAVWVPGVTRKITLRVPLVKPDRTRV